MLLLYCVFSTINAIQLRLGVRRLAVRVDRRRKQQCRQCPCDGHGLLTDDSSAEHDFQQSIEESEQDGLLVYPCGKSKCPLKEEK